MAAVVLVLITHAVSDGPTGRALPVATGPDTGASTIYGGPTGRVALRTWVLHLDPNDVGLSQGLTAGAFGGRTVTVPDVANPTPVSGPSVDANYAGSIAWYRTSFQLPAAGAYVLHFESANFRATTWLDGRRLGTHVGEYLPFEYRFHAGAGPHTVVARVDWRDPAAQTVDGFHRTWFNFGGLDREVSVRPVGESELSAPSVQTALSRDGGTADVTVGVQIRNNGPARVVTPTATLTHGSETTPVRFGPLRMSAGALATATTHVTLHHPALWAPGSPNLYQLQMQVGQESGYRALIGLRQVTWSGGHMYLNGHPLTLHGASLAEDAPGRGDALLPADQARIVAELQAIHANATRSQHPLDPGLLERLDAAGILVWQGIGPVDSSGNWTSVTPKLMRLALRRVRISVRQAQLHPSIIAWNLANEIAANGHPGGQAAYIERSAAWLHANDPGRIVAVDVWGEYPPRVPGPLYADLDAVSMTDYAGWYDDPTGTPAGVEALIRNRIGALATVLPGKVLLVSEFGAEGNASNPNPELGSYGRQSAIIAENIHAYESLPALGGMLVWSLRDFAVAPTFSGGRINRYAPGIQLVKGVDQKGLFGYDLAPKPAVAVVAKAFAALGND
jgi:hypothetical protein